MPINSQFVHLLAQVLCLIFSYNTTASALQCLLHVLIEKEGGCEYQNIVLSTLVVNHTL